MNFLESSFDYAKSLFKEDRHDRFRDHAAFSRPAHSGNNHLVCPFAFLGLAFWFKAKGGSGRAKTAFGKGGTISALGVRGACWGGRMG